jgi:starvation-inducible outer membrane lipoprotein
MRTNDVRGRRVWTRGMVITLFALMLTGCEGCPYGIHSRNAADGQRMSAPAGDHRTLHAGVAAPVPPVAPTVG